MAQTMAQAAKHVLSQTFYTKFLTRGSVTAMILATHGPNIPGNVFGTEDKLHISKLGVARHFEISLATYIYPFYRFLTVRLRIVARKTMHNNEIDYDHGHAISIPSMSPSKYAQTVSSGIALATILCVSLQLNHEGSASDQIYKKK